MTEKIIKVFRHGEEYQVSLLQVPNGLYEIHWLADSLRYSLASVGRDTAGRPWIAPCNWVGGIPYTKWEEVSHLVELVTNSVRISEKATTEKTTAEKTANDRQVGGSHYQEAGAVQHWDLVAMFQLDYMQGQITKYVFRHKKKNGLEDLRKARHFLDKYIELEKTRQEGIHLKDPEDGGMSSVCGTPGRRSDQPDLVTCYLCKAYMVRVIDSPESLVERAAESMEEFVAAMYSQLTLLRAARTEASE